MNATPDLPIVLVIVLVVAFALAGSAKVAAVPAMRSRAQHVGFSVHAYRGIGALELFGVLGLLAGLLFPVLAVLAGAGLLALLGGAVMVHLRNRDGLREIAPAAVLGILTTVYLVLAVGGLR